jgi:hypothetical protein
MRLVLIISVVFAIALYAFYARPRCPHSRIPLETGIVSYNNTLQVVSHVARSRREIEQARFSEACVECSGDRGLGLACNMSGLVG